MNKFKNYLYNHFHIREHNSSIRTEIIAGITDFFTMIYLVILVPEILINAFPGATDMQGNFIYDAVLYNGYTTSQMLIALTNGALIASAIGSITMGLIVNVPFIQGPSLAIGTFVTYTICSGFGYTFEQALAIVFISGLLFLILSVFNIEFKINNAIPHNIKLAVTSGIGLFIAYTGFKKSYIISLGTNAFNNAFNLSDISSPETKTALLTLAAIIIIVILLEKKIHAGIFIGKILCIIAAILIGLVPLSNINFSDFFDITTYAFKMDFSIINTNSNTDILRSLLTIFISVFSICIMDILETMSMLITTENINEHSNGKIKIEKKTPKILETDAAATMIGSLFSSSTVSTYVESTTGIVEGGRTGLCSVICGILFLFSIFLTPLVSIIPSAATASTLIVAGLLMMNIIKKINFNDITEALPAFLTMFIMPLSNSIITGIAFGIITYVIIHILNGNFKKISPMLYFLAIFFGIFFYYM